MAMVDAQGRLFGRLNLLDAVLLLLLAGLIPLGYGAYAMFRTPAPSLTSVEPATLQQGPNLRVTVQGEHLRPFMRISFGPHQGASFIFRNPMLAEVDLGDVPAGTYDVVLYDHAQERARLQQALTILPVPLPHTEVVVVGSFANLTADTAPRLTIGSEIPGVGEIIAVGRALPEATRVYAGNLVIEIPVETAVRLPVAIRARCQVHATVGYPQCAIEGVALAPTVFLLLSTPVGTLPFQVDQVRGSHPLESVRVRVRLTGLPGVLAQVAVGDVDHGPFVNELAAGATVRSAGALRRVNEDQAVREVELIVHGQHGPSGWTYAAGPLRAGAGFVLRTPRYEVQGTVIAFVPDGARTGAGGQ